MGAAIMAILAGVCLIAMVVYPLGKAPLRENEVAGWAAWRKEFAFSMKFYNPYVIIYEGVMGWNSVFETIARFGMLAFGLGILTTGGWLLCVGFVLLGAA